MHVGTWAARTPDKPALVFDDGTTGTVVTYAELDTASNRLAHYLRDEIGLQPGAGIALVLGNIPEFGVAWWAAMRSGLYITPVNWHLSPEEVTYVIEDSGASVVIFEERLSEVVNQVVREGRVIGLSAGPSTTGLPRFDEVLARHPAEPLEHETYGSSMFYSSGTTGRPKGIRAPLSGLDPASNPGLGESILDIYGITADDRYLSPGPLYHSSPSIWSFGMNTVGATAVVMQRFDAERALELIEQHGITVSQWVPTMFSRLLALPDDVRNAYDLSTHRVAFHAAAPCPVDVKRRMIEWWGPILEEFYAGTEGGSTRITSQEWLERPGSVGRHWTGGTIHILDPTTREPLPPGREGLIFFDVLANHRFQYHNAPDKTASTYHDGLVTLGDIGYVDEDGYLFLTDRASDMIISGGVNIYPRSIEEVLLGDPRVMDVAVIGVPDDDMGESVKAVVQLTPGVETSTELEAELIERCRAKLGSINAPRSVDVTAQLPRDANGKLYKRRLREQYWSGRSSRLV